MHKLVQKSVMTLHFSARKSVSMKLYREIFNYLREWKSSSDRKPLLLRGARQVGKSWVMQQFGEQYFEYCVKFDFDRQSELKQVFQNTKDPRRILKELSIYSENPIIPEKTLIIFDEIQECEEALNSLKYFYEETPEYPVIAAGSLLGVAVKRKKMTVPVGKISIKRMYPLTFKEFLHSSDLATYEYIDRLQEIKSLPEIILNKLLTEYRRYSICGGMPEAVLALLENKGTEHIEKILQDILDLYELDFSKYASPVEIPRINAIWHSLPSQLAKENRKFIYKILKTGARSKDYEDALLWLEDAGLIYRINNASKPGLPLSSYLERDVFKVYACDCGLLRRLAKLSANALLSPLDSFTEFKGALAENFVLESLIPECQDDIIAYWSSDGRAEIDFLLQNDTEIIPIEVKAGNSVTGKSLYVYKNKYEPNIMVRLSLRNLEIKENLINLPLPMISWLKSTLQNSRFNY